MSSLVRQNMLNQNSCVVIDDRPGAPLASTIEAYADAGDSKDAIVRIKIGAGQPRNTNDRPFDLRSDLDDTGISQLLSLAIQHLPGNRAIGFAHRLINMVDAVFPAWAWLHQKNFAQDFYHQRFQIFRFETLTELACTETAPNMPADLRNAVLECLADLPRYDPSKGIDQSVTTLDQHGYLEMIANDAIRLLGADVSITIDGILPGLDALDLHRVLEMVVADRKTLLVSTTRSFDNGLSERLVDLLLILIVGQVNEFQRSQSPSKGHIPVAIDTKSPLVIDDLTTMASLQGNRRLDFIFSIENISPADAWEWTCALSKMRLLARNRIALAGTSNKTLVTAMPMQRWQPSLDGLAVMECGSKSGVTFRHR